jgi:2-dehydropantoate 2-reductase
MRVAVMGAGGVGGYYGGMLARAGEDVTFIARGAHLDAMRSNGLTVKTTHVGEFTVPVSATSDPRGLAPVDLVLFCVKTYDTEAATRLVQPIIGERTVVLPLQNGVESPARIASILGTRHVIGGTTYVSSRVESPGVVHETWVYKAYLGELDGRLSRRTVQIAEAFDQAGVAAEISPDIQVAMWSKHLAISAFAAVGCVTRLPRGIISSVPETASLNREIMKEGLAVARASGVPIADDFWELQRCVGNTITDPMMRPSMYYDLEAGKPLELEDLLGVIVRLGHEHGVATPLTFAMYAALKPYANGKPELPRR